MEQPIIGSSTLLFKGSHSPVKNTSIACFLRLDKRLYKGKEEKSKKDKSDAKNRLIY